ncbi:hypothetical protein BB560_003490 [Smittium megazygosporum]|uniref:Mannose-P-dolichol utilization defect 1 protein homolog n=1 Tax=Smittium megazygosporum TaxID=133381 RepID=A0A2T9ZBV6_9FUNG|nr:hypothetical protein BB560_003490 [Smittium megazygosporum]
MSWLPSFIRIHVVTLLGENCTQVLVDNLNLFEPTCFKLAISKALGLGIVLGGCIVKLPQILKILKSHSVHGLSFVAFFMETIANAVTVAFNFRQSFPFTTYGESLFIGIQNFIISLLILALNGSVGMAVVLSAFSIFSGYLLFDPNWVSFQVLSALQTATIPIVIGSRFSQIYKIHNEKTTGQLSAFSVFNYFFGSLARVYTTFVEVDNKIILAGFLSSFIANAILALQMLYYWNSESKPIKKHRSKASSKKSKLN